MSWLKYWQVLYSPRYSLNAPIQYKDGSLFCRIPVRLLRSVWFIFLMGTTLMITLIAYFDMMELQSRSIERLTQHLRPAGQAARHL